MIRCNNCGADIEETQTQCPYCHAMQYEASEKEYMNHLYKMNDTMDGLDENANRYIRNRIICHAVITLAAVAAALLVGTAWGYTKYRSYYNSASERREIAEGMAWYDENVPQINEAYEQGNFADISEVTADSYKNKILQQWKHYNILYIYKYAYSDTLRYDDKIAQGTPLESYEFENLYRSCMEYMNMLEDTDGYMYRYYKSCDAQEKEIISTWTQHVKAVLTDTIGQSEADYAADYQALYGNGDVSNYNMFREKTQKYEK